MSESPTATESKPRYKWPWYVLAALLLGLVLAVLWMSVAVRRTREQREGNPMPALQGASQ